MCYLTALFWLPLLASRAPTVAWGCLIGVHSVKSVTQRPPAARGEALVGGVAQNGVISPARVVCVVMIEFTIPGPVLIITPRNSMGAIIAWKGTVWYLLSIDQTDLQAHMDRVAHAQRHHYPYGMGPRSWGRATRGRGRESAPRPSFIPQRVTPMIRDFTF